MTDRKKERDRDHAIPKGRVRCKVVTSKACAHIANGPSARVILNHKAGLLGRNSHKLCAQLPQPLCLG